MKKSLLMTILCVVSLSSNAQIFKSHAGTSAEPDSKLVKQVDIYLQDKWGVGFTLRKESSSRFGWNFLGASYMSGWHDCECPKKFGIVNVRPIGLRYNIPIRGNFKFYAEGMPGYSFVYHETKYIYMMWGGEIPYYKTDKYKSHCFGLDVSAGFQVLKNLSVGYNYTFLATINDNTDNYHIHWARISLMF